MESERGLTCPISAPILLQHTKGFDKVRRGFSGYIAYLIDFRHVPWVFAFLAVVAEFFGALGLLAGFLSRIAAFGVAVVMIVAMALVHIHYGFFMNWDTNKPGEGFEFFILGLAMAAAVMLKGGGAFSLDRLLNRLYRHQMSPGRISDVRK